MYMRKFIALFCLTLTFSAAQAQQFGEPATQADIDKRFFSVFPDGEFLPDGEGTVAEGAVLFEDQCELCHGTPDEKGIADVLFGGHGTLGTPQSLATVGSYWPYPTTVFNYVRRAMPYVAPMSLTNSEYYSITAYLLHENGIIAEDDLINKDTLPKVEMPNKDGFINAYPEIPDDYKTRIDDE